ncbi:MAG TPA: DUF115 domain-containing protein [Panacibacter sp.]|nr:DUF115 domain-containing protein [Panacibacter sp.]HNP46623.1 DUF115 domain-containing protein [Panacibacter sp.]
MIQKTASRFTLSRIIPAIKRRVKELLYLFSWTVGGAAKHNKRILLSYHNRYQGKRLFLIANGPSIKDMDLSALKGELTMCMNRFYIYFDKIGFIPNFLVCVEDLVLEQFGEDINKLPLQKFVNWRFHKKLNDCNFLKESYAFNPFFQGDLTRPTHFGGTVTFACLQLAYYMGFSEVILIGLDHSFKEKGTPATTEVRNYEKDESHFDPNYFPKGTRWKLPDLDKSEYGYAIARDHYKKNGRKIIDATINGHCTIFEKADYYGIIKSVAA